MTKKQKDAAFIEKCKSIGISVSKAKPDQKCVFCGGPADHEISVRLEMIHQTRHDGAGEESFAA